MEDLKDKAIVDMAKYNKLVEFYNKVRQNYVSVTHYHYGGFERIKYVTESEAIKELGAECDKLNADYKILVQQLNNAREEISHLKAKNIQNFQSRERELNEVKADREKYKNKARNFEKNYLLIRKYFAGCSIWKFWFWRKRH